MHGTTNAKHKVAMNSNELKTTNEAVIGLLIRWRWGKGGQSRTGVS
jgi:hypothetical protein